MINANNSDSDGSDDYMEESGLKEEVYREKLEALHRQLEQVRNGTHPEYKKRMKNFDEAHKERINFAMLTREIEISEVQRDFMREKNAAKKEFEEKKEELKINLLMEAEEKKKIIEQERYSLDLNGDSQEYKAASTRKLRRRGNDPTPTVEKRRKNVSNGLQFLLSEADIEDDLRVIYKNRVPMRPKTNAIKATNLPTENNSNEPRIENGKLYFDKKWFQKGQSVVIDCKDGSRYNAILMCAENNYVVMKKTSDNTRVKITLPQLAHGKFLVRRRTAGAMRIADF